MFLSGAAYYPEHRDPAKLGRANPHAAHHRSATQLRSPVGMAQTLRLSGTYADVFHDERIDGIVTIPPFGVHILSALER